MSQSYHDEQQFDPFKVVSPMRPYEQPPSASERQAMHISSLRELDQAYGEVHISCILVSEYFEDGNTGFTRNPDLTDELRELEHHLGVLGENIRALDNRSSPTVPRPLEINQEYCVRMRRLLLPLIHGIREFVNDAGNIREFYADTQVTSQVSEATITATMLDSLKTEYQKRDNVRIIERGYTNVLRTDVPNSSKSPIEWKYQHLLDMLLKISSVLAKLWRDFENLLRKARPLKD